MGMTGLAIFALMLLVASCKPLLANDNPIVCRFQGSLYFPAVVEAFHQIPGASSVYGMPKPFGFPQFQPRLEIDPKRGDWAWWAPVPHDPIEVDLDRRLQPPSSAHWLGTDALGRDMLARMIHGTAVSMQVGFISMGIAACIGLIIGAMAGYFGGWVDQSLSRLIEIVICFPTFFLILSILVWLPPSIYNVMVVIGLTAWTSIARYTRGEFMKLKTLDYAVAARALGGGATRIMFRHLLPNALAPVTVVVTFGIAAAILTEAALSFLGFGVMPPAPSWGNMLRGGYDLIRTAGPHLIFPPCLAIFLGVMSFNMIGDALRDVTDPRLYGS